MYVTNPDWVSVIKQLNNQNDFLSLTTIAIGLLFVTRLSSVIHFLLVDQGDFCPAIQLSVSIHSC